MGESFVMSLQAVFTPGRLDRFIDDVDVRRRIGRALDRGEGKKEYSGCERKRRRTAGVGEVRGASRPPGSVLVSGHLSRSSEGVNELYRMHFIRAHSIGAREIEQDSIQMHF